MTKHQLSLFTDPIPPVGWAWIDRSGFMYRVDKHEPLRSDPDTIGATCTLLQLGTVYRFSPEEYKNRAIHSRYPEPFLLKEQSS